MSKFPVLVPAPIAQLGRHPTGRGDLPSLAVLLQHVRQQEDGHWTVRPYRGHRWHQARTGQVLIRVDRQVWNLARALLQRSPPVHAGRAYQSGCGLSGCVRPSHWTATAPPRAVYTFQHLGGSWRLCGRSGPVSRDMVVVAGIPAGPLHVVRVLAEPDGSRLVALCGAAMDPAVLVIQKMDASCLACIGDSS